MKNEIDLIGRTYFLFYCHHFLILLFIIILKLLSFGSCAIDILISLESRRSSCQVDSSQQHLVERCSFAKSCSLE